MDDRDLMFLTRTHDDAICDRLIPVLVSCAVYSQDQIAEFDALPKVDEHIPDAAEDIRPMFHRSKNGGAFNRMQVRLNRSNSEGMFDRLEI